MIRRLSKGKTKDGERLQDVIQSCLTYLDTCTDFWTQENPICSRYPKKKPRHSAPREPAQFFLKSLDEIDTGKAGF